MKQFISFFKTKFYIAITVAIVVFSVVATVFITTNINKAVPVFEEKTVVDVKVIEERIRSIAELVTLNYDYSDVGMFSEQKSMSLFGKEINIIGTKKSFIITYDGEMKFGLDLSQISVNEANNIISVTLPPTKLISHTIHEDSIKLLDEESGLFTSHSIMDYTEFVKEQKDKMEERAIDNNALEQARSSAEVQIKALILSLPNVDDEYEIRFVG